MPETGQGADYFVFVCVPERQARYAAAVASLPYRFVFVADARQLLNRCVEEPPRAVLIDIPSSARIGAALVNSLLEFRTAWPVVRCLMRPDGVVDAMSASSDRSGELAEALRAITTGDPGWLPPWKRRHVRAAVQCRVRLRTPEGRTWRLGNSLDLSQSGAFILSYDAYAIGDRIELELWDLVDQPLILPAHIARLRRWDEGTQLPGIGVAFEAGTIPPELSRVLADLLVANALAR